MRLSLFRQQLLPLALAEVDGHLLSLECGVVHLGSQEDLCLGLFDDLDSQVASVLLALLSLLHLLLLFFDGLLGERCSHGWLNLLLLLFRFLHGPVDVDHRRLPLEELVDLVVGLRDHLGGLGPAPLVARWGILLGGSVDQSGQVPGG